jgi:hypothetical protein
MRSGYSTEIFLILCHLKANTKYVADIGEKALDGSIGWTDSREEIIWHLVFECTN